MLSLTLCAVLSAVDGGASFPIRVQVMAGDQPAPAETEVRLFFDSGTRSPLCGTAQYNSAPLRYPDARGRVDFGENAPGHYGVELTHLNWGQTTQSFEVPGEVPVARFAKGADLRVRVLTANGAPAANAVVHLVPEHFDRQKGDRLIIARGNDGAYYQSIRRAESDENGVVVFRGVSPRNYAVVARRDDYVLGRGVVTDAGAQVEVRLPEAFAISGRVLTTDGGVIENPWVIVEAIDKPKSDERTAQTWDGLLAPVPAQPTLDRYATGYGTDGGATFTVETHFRGRALVSASLDGCETTPAVEVQPPGEVVLRAGPRTLVKGKIRSADRKPIDETLLLSFTCHGEFECHREYLKSPEFALELPVNCTNVSVKAWPREVERAFKLREGRVTDLGELVLPAAKKR